MVDRVVSLMKEREITGVQLSGILGLPKNSVAEWKRNSYKPSIETLSKLAELFEVSTDYLLGRTDIKEPVNAPGKKKEPTMRLVSKKEIMNMDKDKNANIQKQYEMLFATVDKITPIAQAMQKYAAVFKNEKLFEKIISQTTAQAEVVAAFEEAKEHGEEFRKSLEKVNTFIQKDGDKDLKIALLELQLEEQRNEIARLTQREMDLHKEKIAEGNDSSEETGTRAN